MLNVSVLSDFVYGAILFELMDYSREVDFFMTITYLLSYFPSYFSIFLLVSFVLLTYYSV